MKPHGPGTTIQAGAETVQSRVGTDGGRPDQWTFIDALGDGVYGIDTQGRCTFINKAALALLRFALAEELIGRNMHDLIHHTRPNGTYYPVAECPLVHTLVSGKPVRLDNELLWRKDMTSFLAEYSSFPILADGVVTGSVITFNDASVRENAQGRLALQHAVTQVMAQSPDLASAPDEILAAIGSGFGWDVGAFWLLGTKQGVGKLRCAAVWQASDASDAFRKLSEVLRVDRDATPSGLDWEGDASVYTADFDGSRSSLLNDVAAREGLLTSLAFPVRAGNETIGAIEFFSRRLIDLENGIQDAVLALGQQIGEFIKRQRVEQDLRDSESLKSAILESALDCVIAITGDSLVVEFNPAAERTFGIARGDILGRDLAELIMPAEFRDKRLKGMARYITNGEGSVLGKRIEVEALRANGERFPAELAITPTQVGGETRFTAYMRDITERRRGERELAAARDAAEEANRAKSLFMANMSHELRTPLSAIIGYSEMMQDEISDGVEAAELVPDLAKVEANARHLLGLINDVLDLSKIESGKMEVYAETFDAASTVRDVAAAVDSLMGRKGNTLVIDVGTDLGSMHSDVTKVRQILMNLLSNAAKFTEGGTITFSGTRIIGAGSEGWLTFRVADTGIGMSAEQLGRLFLRFSQADASTTRKFGGTGLGLSITKAFSIMLGGDILVESSLGHGSTFTVLLPAIMPDPATRVVAVEAA